MPRPRRYYQAQQVYYATARIRRGLPLVPDRLMNSLILGLLARTQSHYPLKIIAFVFMGNHFHIMFLCEDPQNVKNFFCYLKGELAFAINKLLGRHGEVWAGRTDIPRIVTAAKIIEMMVYTYTNPQEAHLTDTIDEYPGLSGWQAISSGECKLTAEWIRGSQLRKLRRDSEQFNDRAKLLAAIQSEDNDTHTFCLSPFAWLEYSDTDMSVDDARAAVIAGVREREADLRRERKRGVLGSRLLTRARIDRAYIPRKFGKRVMFICDEKQLRKRLIQAYRAIVDECREIYEEWKQGDFRRFFPPGTFAPPPASIASALAGQF